jgi:hypothetical protein
MARANALDFCRDTCLSLFEFRDARTGVRLGSLGDLPKQRKNRHQARLGAHELPLVEA